MSQPPFRLNCYLYAYQTNLRNRRLEVVGTRKNGRARRRHPHPSRVSLARARSLFRPLLPSTCFEGYERGDISGKKNVEDNENFKLLWDFSKQIDKKLDHNRPDIASCL